MARAGNRSRGPFRSGAEDRLRAEFGVGTGISTACVTRTPMASQPVPSGADSLRSAAAMWGERKPGRIAGREHQHRGDPPAKHSDGREALKPSPQGAEAPLDGLRKPLRQQDHGADQQGQAGGLIQRSRGTGAWSAQPDQSGPQE